jgi:hypothetical protein
VNEPAVAPSLLVDYRERERGRERGREKGREGEREGERERERGREREREREREHGDEAIARQRERWGEKEEEGWWWWGSSDCVGSMVDQLTILTTWSALTALTTHS